VRFILENFLPFGTMSLLLSFLSINPLSSNQNGALPIFRSEDTEDKFSSSAPVRAGATSKAAGPKFWHHEHSAVKRH
jgi:hypothetical protein